MARVCIIILVALVTVNLVKSGSCPNQFIRLGNFCYHFSDIEEDWVGARGFCEGIGAFEEETILMGVLDFGLNIHDNQLLITNASNRGGTYWLGGSLEETSDIWRWADYGNKEIDLHANYWYDGHPSSAGDCLMVKKEMHRSYVLAADCSQRSKVICQIIPKEIGFRTIGKDSFYFSTENNFTPENTWQEARDICLSLQPPNNFDHVDLAVLGLNHELDQDLLQVIAEQGYDAWLGGRHIANGDGGVAWIDARNIEETSYFLYSGHSTLSPNAVDYFTHASVTSVNGHARSVVKFCCPGDCVSDYRCRTTQLHFVCQAFKSSNNTTYLA